MLRMPASQRLALALAASAAAFAVAPPAAADPPAARTAAAATPLPSTPARAAPAAAGPSFDGVVEAVRQTVIAAQVSGAIVELAVRAGDHVAAGQVLARIDARTAEQAAAAGDAQLRAARAAQDLATSEFQRQQALHQAQFISAAALDRARAEHQAAQAQAAAQAAQAQAARTQTALHVVRAPYAGVVSEVPVALGDMAMPGRPLVTVYDPSALRVTASVPLGVAARLPADAAVRVELPTLPEGQRLVIPKRVERLPAADAATHTVTLRAELAPTSGGAATTSPLAPGQFARLWLPAASEAAPASGAAAGPASPWVPKEALVRRAELTGLYVVDAQGRPLLRQVRVGRSQGELVEVLSGLAAGERVVTDPQAAARVAVAAR